MSAESMGGGSQGTSPEGAPHRIRKRGPCGGNGLEKAADLAAFLAIPFTGLLVFGGLLAALVSKSLFFVFVCVAIGFIGLFLWLFARFVGEHIRLMKKIAGVDFQGRISGRHDRVFFACSRCGFPSQSETRCDGCGEEYSVRPDSN